MYRVILIMIVDCICIKYVTTEMVSEKNTYCMRHVFEEISDAAQQGIGKISDKLK
jgi:hypothetical protein